MTEDQGWWIFAVLVLMFVSVSLHTCSINSTLNDIEDAIERQECK